MELLNHNFSDMNGDRDWRVANNDERSLDVLHAKANLTIVDYGANHQNQIIASDLSSKDTNDVGRWVRKC